MRKYGRFILQIAGFRAVGRMMGTEGNRTRGQKAIGLGDIVMEIGDRGNGSILDDLDCLVFVRVRYERKAKCIVYTQ